MSTINNTYVNLYNNINDDADVTFVVHGQEVKAHKCIVVDRSDTIKRMLASYLAPADGRHLIADPEITFDDFINFKQFLYFDICIIDLKNVASLWRISDMYFVPFLKEKCVTCIEDKCQSMDGILECCELGIEREYGCPDILVYCLNKLSQSDLQSLTYTSISDTFLVSAELVERIAKDCRRSAVLTEDKLFTKIFEWAKMQCYQQRINDDPESIKSFVSAALKFIKLENVSLKSWFDIIFPYDLASKKKCDEIRDDLFKIVPDNVLRYTPPLLKEKAAQKVKEENINGGN